MSLLGLRNYRVSPPSPPPLPYDYAVEYIETDGVASYINSGIIPTANTVVELRFQFIEGTETGRQAYRNSVCGAHYGNSPSGLRFCIGNPNTASYFFFSFPTLTEGDSPSRDTDEHDVSLGKDVIVFDGVSKIPTFDVDTFGSFCLGCWGLTDEITPLHFSKSRFYSCVIRDNGVIVFNGIPVVVNGVAGMYDSVSGTVKTNAAATGTITAGPRV